MALHSLYCADVLLTHSQQAEQLADLYNVKVKVVYSC